MVTVWLLKVPAVGEPSGSPALVVRRPAQVARRQAVPSHFSTCTAPSRLLQSARSIVVPPRPGSGMRPAEKKL
ncbi:hypothetical protein NOMA109596_18220 [Nocardioides marinus]